MVSWAARCCNPRRETDVNGDSDGADGERWTAVGDGEVDLELKSRADAAVLRESGITSEDLKGSPPTSPAINTAATMSES